MDFNRRVSAGYILTQNFVNKDVLFLHEYMQRRSK
jgi:hypothetical protein